MKWLLVAALSVLLGRVGCRHNGRAHGPRSRHAPAFARCGFQVDDSLVCSMHTTGDARQVAAAHVMYPRVCSDPSANSIACPLSSSFVSYSAIESRGRRRRCQPTRQQRRRNESTTQTMCGVIGILLADREAQVSPELYDGLTILQHRGQDAAGIATSDSRKIFLRKDKGLVRLNPLRTS